MSTISVSSSNTIVNLNGLVGLGPTEALLTANNLDNIVVDVDVGIASAFTVVGSPDSNVTISPSNPLHLNVLSSLFVETKGADVTLAQGDLISADALSGTTIDIDGGGTFQTGSGVITAGVLDQISVSFGSGGGTDLVTDNSALIAINLLNAEAPLAGFTNATDIIADQATDFTDVTGYSITSGSPGVDTITVLTSNGTNFTFAVDGSFATGSFAPDAGPLRLVDDDGGVGISVLCFQKGTNILTPTGAAPIEALQIGDPVVTRFGGIRHIEWIGRQSYDPRFLRNNPGKVPVCIRAGALGPNMPARDLRVSPGHSMLVGDVLVLASSLVNGITITQTLDDVTEAVEYYQLDFGEHDCVIAEGTWSESFSDAPGMRAQFHNAASYGELYPERPPAETQTLCALRPEHGPALSHALRPIVEIAGAHTVPGRLEGYIDTAESWKIIGWAMDQSRPGLPVLLDILAGDEHLGTVLACDMRMDLAEAGKGNGRCGFTFTPPHRLSRDALASLRIVRAGDSSTLAMTDGCHAAIFGTRPTLPTEIRIAS